MLVPYPDEFIQSLYLLDKDGECRSGELRLFSKNLPPTLQTKGMCLEVHILQEGKITRKVGHRHNLRRLSPSLEITRPTIPNQHCGYRVIVS
jgi:hypothetical protein